MKYTDLGCKIFLIFLFSLNLADVGAQIDSIQRGDTLKEVVVTSNSALQRVGELQVGVERVNVETVRQLPTLLGERDVVKSLQLMPGVKGEGDRLGGPRAWWDIIQNSDVGWSNGI